MTARGPIANAAMEQMNGYYIKAHDPGTAIALCAECHKGRYPTLRYDGETANPCEECGATYTKNDTMTQHRTAIIADVSAAIEEEYEHQLSIYDPKYRLCLNAARNDHTRALRALATLRMYLGVEDTQSQRR